MGKSKEDLDNERIEAKKCPMCHEIKPKQFDICEGENNVDACLDCIRKRHEKHGLRGKGFSFNGKEVSFYSQTTCMETYLLEDIYKIFRGLCFPNDIFPYSINIAQKIKVPKKESYTCEECGHKDSGFEEKIETHCYGITKEFGDWLIANLKWDRVSEEEKVEMERTTANHKGGD